MNKFSSNKRLIFLVMTFLITLIYFIQDSDKIKSVLAQSCVSIIPIFVYGSTPLSYSGSGTGCVSRGVTAGGPGTGAYVALTGWNLEYTTSDDHDIESIKAYITGVSETTANIIFTVTACLSENDNDDSFRASVDWVAVRWR